MFELCCLCKDKPHEKDCKNDNSLKTKEPLFNVKWLSLDVLLVYWMSRLVVDRSIVLDFLLFLLFVFSSFCTVWLFCLAMCSHLHKVFTLKEDWPCCWNMSMVCGEVWTGSECVRWTELRLWLGMLLLPPGLANHRLCAKDDHKLTKFEKIYKQCHRHKRLATKKNMWQCNAWTK